MMLPTLILALLLPFLAHQTPNPVPLEQTLRASRWKSRVLLVAAPNAQQADFRQQKQLLAANRTGLNERDFQVLEVLYDQLSATDKKYLIEKTGIRPPAFGVVLIGKDGGVKEKSARPVAPAAWFNLVDKMPMRREEMRRRE